MHFIKNYKLILFTLLVFCVAECKAQDTINSAIVEQKSYQLYNDKNWPELIKYGNMAVKKGFDYFYLQIRMGIAYYEKKNYALATVHFQKALKFNSGDELAQEYLYYCYVFMGRTDDSKKLSKQFSPDLAQKIATNKLHSINFILLEGATKINKATTYKNIQTRTTEQYFQPAKYFQLGLNHSVKNSFSVYHAFSYYNQQYHSARPVLGGRPPLYNTNKIKQLQYYLKVNIPLKNNWTIAPAIHWVNKNFNSSFTIKTPPPPPPGSPPPPSIKDSVISSSSKSNYFVGSIAIQKTVKRLGVSIGTTVSNIDNVNQFIHFGSISYSVLGNSKIVLGCTDYLNTRNNYLTIDNAIAPFIYLQPLKKISLTAS
jgi:tetratricopeptide (TPR) repeat protein